MNQDQDKISEVVGGLKNAIERKEDLEKAKQSFINAGYKKEDVEKASHQLSQAYSLMTTSKKFIQKEQPQQESVQHQQESTPPKEKKPLNKKLILVLAIISGLILVGAGLLGVFWNKIF